MMPDALRERALELPSLSAYRGARCLVTGGLGFIGSNLVHALTHLGASVAVVDARVANQGANDFNFSGLPAPVEVRTHDVADASAMEEAVRGNDFIFNLAAKSGHLESLEDPFADVATNVTGQLVLLEAVRKQAPQARVVHASSRSVYGAIQTSPVAEDHPFLPTEMNSADKAAGELFYTAYWHSHGIRTLSLRLTNTYGPRMPLSHPGQGFINWFVRLGLAGEEITLYGDGSQQRDMLHVDDAVEAFLLAGVNESLNGAALNVGSGQPVSLREVAETIVRVGGSGAVRYVPYPDSARRIEIGDFVADVSKITQSLGWRPRTGLQQGLADTCRFFSAHREHYF